MTDLTLPRCLVPDCSERRPRKQHLCVDCWRALLPQTRGRLARSDFRTPLRHHHLHQALAEQTPLDVIRVPR